MSQISIELFTLGRQIGAIGVLIGVCTIPLASPLFNHNFSHTALVHISVSSARSLIMFRLNYKTGMISIIRLGKVFGISWRRNMSAFFEQFPGREGVPQLTYCYILQSTGEIEVIPRYDCKDGKKERANSYESPRQHAMAYERDREPP